jgi:hypothetical protein
MTIWLKFTLSLSLIVLSFNVMAKDSSPCRGVSRDISTVEKSELVQPVTAQLKNKDLNGQNLKNIEILASFQYKKWQILYVNTFVTDEAYLFYSKNPRTQPYLILWAGAAAMDEEQEIFKWVRSKAKGIPSKLARCFSWHVTKEPR